MVNSRNRIVVFLLGGSSLLVAVLFGRSVLLSRDMPTRAVGHGLRILTYSTFVDSSGPGPQLIAQFKRVCNCDVEVASATDAGLLLERLRLSRKANPFDLVIGLDQLTIGEAEKTFGWSSLQFVAPNWRSEIRSHVTEHFAAIDWAPMTFIYRRGEVRPPESLQDLTRADLRNAIALQDPRSSTPGLIFLNWVVGAKGIDAREFLESLKPNIASVSPSWSMSYGLFKSDRAKLVFSYLTSLVFHWQVESDRRFQAAVFAGGHPFQVEYAGIPDFCHECALAQEFLKLLLSQNAQQQIAERNFMYPAIADVTLPPVFGELPKVKLIEVPSDKDAHIWVDVFRR